ncbi:hypothetical protein Leryth_009540 [Lithospermum erythrorhizon]|nr:hypothetical protein Leryth_009540 [Lithospermum erythrorhizon]
MDVATKENMENLSKIGTDLLEKPVSRVNLHTGLFEPLANGGTNADALQKFARILSEEKRLRELNSP